MALLIVGMLGVGVVWLGVGAAVALMVGRSLAERDAEEVVTAEAATPATPATPAAPAAPAAAAIAAPVARQAEAPLRVSAQSRA
jgi:ribosomal protein L12E/L44/L45/RPP1/RPP2